MNVTKELSCFVVDTGFKDLPKEVTEQSKVCFLDWFGAALGGSLEPLSSILQELIYELGGREQATVLGKGKKTSLLNAALINGAMSHALDYDDTHADTLIHPSAPLIPAILAVAEYRHLSGKDMISAFILGFEAETRIGLAMGPSHYTMGWHATSTFGRFGAAAGAGKLMGLTKEEMACAFGIAATQSGGLRQVFGSMCKPLHPGKAAMDGILSVLLAKKGFTAPKNILEGASGFSEVFSKDYDLSIVTSGLGETYQVLNDTFKPHASCLLTHPTIDALIELKNKHNLSTEEIAGIDCEVTPLCLDAAGKPEPQTPLDAKFSVYFCAASAVQAGKAGQHMFTNDRVLDARIIDLQKKVTATANPKFKETEAKVSIRTYDDGKYESHITAPRGDPRNPLSRRELENKFTGLALKVLPGDKVSRIIDRIHTLDKMDDVNELIELCIV